MLRRRNEAEREKGQILVLFALVLVVILAFAAIAIDLGVLRNNRQILRNTMDAAALAGGTLMPVDGSVPGAATAVATLINSTIQTNYPGLRHSATAIGSRCVVGVDDANIAAGACDYTVSYRCLIGADSSGPLVSRDIPATCDPRPSLGVSGLASQFTGAGDTRTSPCDPSAGDKCNAVVVVGSSTTQYAFAPVVGIANGSTGAVSSAACGGPCGTVPLTLNDVELVVDKSGSMASNYSGTPSEPRIYWARLAANQLVTDLANNGGIGATGNRVGITTFSGIAASSDGTAWTSTAAQLATKINAISASGNTPTALGMQTATADLIANARNAVGGKVKRVVIFVSDGRPNPDLGRNGLPATSAAGNQRPTLADITAYRGSADIAYSILIGTSPSYYAIGQGPPLSPNINDPEMMKLLATPDQPLAVPPQIYYYNVVDASGLPSVFHQIAGQILGSGAHLIQLYPTPVVTSASGPTTAVVITGQYFTGVTSVTIGGTPWPVVTSTDTSITVTHPASPPWTAGSSGTKVDVIVTTLGGTSPITSADQYTWP
jgi:hypothetical protein